ncbi:MAG: hypothetical protein MK008_00035 [Bdellovibrionales bacterium]|nr:hypothetical protein [Bdellovibrionales bacterium]
MNLYLMTLILLISQPLFADCNYNGQWFPEGRILKSDVINIDNVFGEHSGIKSIQCINNRFNLIGRTLTYMPTENKNRCTLPSGEQLDLYESVKPEHSSFNLKHFEQYGDIEDIMCFSDGLRVGIYQNLTLLMNEDLEALIEKRTGCFYKSLHYSAGTSIYIDDNEDNITEYLLHCSDKSLKFEKRQI